MTDKTVRRHLSALRGDRLARILPEDDRGGPAALQFHSTSHLYLRPARPPALQSFPRYLYNLPKPATIVPGGPAASPACRNPRHQSRRNIRSRDTYTICPNPRRSFLEGRRPRRLVATRDINRVETFAPAISIRSAQTRDHRSWRAGGLAGLSRPATSIASKHLYLWLAGPQALHGL